MSVRAEPEVVVMSSDHFVSTPSFPEIEVVSLKRTKDWIQVIDSEVLQTEDH
jgi:hypothetical protein